MKITQFEDIIVWQKSQELALKIYKMTDRLKDTGFSNQMRRAAIQFPTILLKDLNEGQTFDV